MLAACPPALGVHAKPKGQYARILIEKRYGRARWTEIVGRCVCRDPCDEKEKAMVSVGGNAYALVAQLIAVLLLFLLPIIIGFTAVRRDANRLGEPGWIWALLTIPLGWLTILAYVVTRALLPRR
jgi:hypothetical protein